MIEATITAARLVSVILLCIYLGEFAGVVIAEALDALRRWRIKRQKERRELRGAAYRCPPPPPPYQPTAPVATPPPDKGSNVQPPAHWTDPRDEPPPQGCTADERAEMLAEFEATVRRFKITPCRICANHNVSVTQWPCSCCTGGKYFVAKWRRDGEVVHTQPLPPKVQR